MNLEYASADIVKTDVNLKLLSNEPLEAVGFGKIYPKTLREIAKLGYSKYLKYLNIFNISISDFVEVDMDDISVFDIFILFGDQDLSDVLVDSLIFFLNATDVVLDRSFQKVKLNVVEDGEIISKEINSQNFDSISQVIKLQNYITKIEDLLEGVKKDQPPMTEGARKAKEKIMQRRQIVEKVKQKNNEDSDEVDLFSIVSTLSSKSNSIDELSIFNLSIFQIYTKFRRIEKIDRFDIGVKSLLAGAQNVKLGNYYGAL